VTEPVKRPRLTFLQFLGWLGFLLVFLLTAAVMVWRGDILRAMMDPEVPFQTYDPPPAPDYAKRASWALLDARTPGSGPAGVFFVHSTTYDGRHDWNAPIATPASDTYLTRVVIPNYAGPFERSGTISAPLYRQASLYTRMTIRRDARDARAFAYRDIDAAFATWLTDHPTGPIVLAGVEQGGELIERLVRERIAPDSALRRRLVVAYVMDAVVVAEGLSSDVPACGSRQQVGCVVAWAQMVEGDEGAANRRLSRGQVWDGRGRVVGLDGRAAVCVNPVTGSASEELVPARRHLGAANATGLEWGVRPAFRDRLITTRCADGLLRHSDPKSESFRSTGTWADRRKALPYNLFYADIEADVQARLTAWKVTNPG